jgi:YidC/Oxa1 family membrane protein insertase
MDKQTTLGFILISVILIGWLWLMTPHQSPVQAPPVDSVAKIERAVPEMAIQRVEQPVVKDSLGRFFAPRQTGVEKTIVVKTDLYTAEISTRGGLIKKWELSQYLTWDKHPVQLVDYDAGGDLSLLFTSADGKLVNTRELYFDGAFTPWSTVTLTGTETRTVELILPVGNGGALVKRLTFTNGKYSFDAEFAFRNLQAAISNFEYQVVWERGLRYAEHNSIDESSFVSAYAFSGGEVAELDAKSAGETVRQDINGNTRWAAARTKYFAVALIGGEGVAQGAYLEGNHVAVADHGAIERYTVALKMPFKGSGSESGVVTVYLGPLDYDVVKSYGVGLEKTMNLGAAWIIRPISEYVMIPVFTLLRTLIPNYGIVLIVFGILMKLVLNPLTKTSMRSMRKMQALNPMITEIREKYKDNPEKMNQQIMNLYKEYGINPAAGCLPLLLHMPIMFALWAVLRSSIELRQASFVWWITDLSIPDVVAKLPFTIPLFGIQDISGVALAMGITMFVQQKMSTTDPRQKAMVWIMPIMLTLLFNSFPSGLNLYYLVFNVLSIGQQFWMKRQGEEPLRKVEPKKRGGGILGKIAKDLPKLRQPGR